ncbi:FecCD family ABC transporter permease [Brevibacillus sp. SYSU BS000544]|uniref:FecCD family ABC transporter permease n=1 Tax=Brevibacillus sp. SYSU BS000544 TaxID=3416443 RepID=UPI003CE4DF60
MFFSDKTASITRLLFFLCLLFLCCLASLIFGTKQVSYQTVFSSFTAYTGSEDHVIIQTVRLPRTMIALAVGAALGVSGAIMQSITRNPLASPELLGLNSGAALGVVCSLLFFQNSSISYIWFAFAGATIIVTLVFALGSIGRAGLSPIKLTLAGATITALSVSFTQGFLILDERSLDEMRFWLAGSISGRSMEQLYEVLPFILSGLLLSFLLARHIATLSLGEEVAAGLGQKTGWIKGLSLLTVVLLAGSSVTIAGPIGFIGLAVPHLIKPFTGFHYKTLLIYSGIVGAILLVAADITSRFILYPQDVSVGIMTAILGGPFLIYLVRKKEWK